MMLFFAILTLGFLVELFQDNVDKHQQVDNPIDCHINEIWQLNTNHILHHINRLDPNYHQLYASWSILLWFVSTEWLYSINGYFQYLTIVLVNCIIAYLNCNGNNKHQWQITKWYTMQSIYRITSIRSITNYNDRNMDLHYGHNKIVRNAKKFLKVYDVSFQSKIFIIIWYKWLDIEENDYSIVDLLNIG